MFKEFGVTNLEVTKDDIYKNPSNPILRMYDDDELIGTFSILTGEVLGKFGTWQTMIFVCSKSKI